MSSVQNFVYVCVFPLFCYSESETDSLLICFLHLAETFEFDMSDVSIYTFIYSFQCIFFWYFHVLNLFFKSFFFFLGFHTCFLFWQHFHFSFLSNSFHTCLHPLKFMTSFFNNYCYILYIHTYVGVHIHTTWWVHCYPNAFRADYQEWIIYQGTHF